MPRHDHADLAVALKEAAVDVLIERGGAASFSLREVARRAGVSHAAPAHHFGDAEGLLTAVAAEGWQTLTAAMAAALEGLTDAREMVHALGAAYVRTAMTNPGHYAVMLNPDVTNPDQPDCAAASLNAYMHLQGVVEAVRDQLNPDLDVDAAALLAWSAMHGLVGLSPVLGHVAETTGTAEHPVTELADRFSAIMLSGLVGR